ncbi:MAG: DUF2092 domain-containing protein, partial [Kiritimatiellae bacterium]|nr:DUF2092 domain-containing protein [Kiritimatiellia bacterium]
MRRQYRFGNGLIMLFLALVSGVPAVEITTRGLPQIDPDTRRIMKEWGDALRAARSLAVDIETHMTTEAEGFKQEISTGHRLLVVRPNRFAYRPTVGTGGVSIVSDGTSLHSYLPAVKKYVVRAAPASIAEIPTVSEVWKFGIPAALGGIKLLEAIVAEQPDAVLLAHVDSGRYMGTVEFNGVKCHLLKFVQDKVEWDAFVQKEGAPLLLKIVP